MMDTLLKQGAGLIVREIKKKAQTDKPADTDAAVHDLADVVEALDHRMTGIEKAQAMMPQEAGMAGETEKRLSDLELRIAEFANPPGDSGTDTATQKWIQTVQRHIGIPEANADGIYGPATQAAWNNFVKGEGESAGAGADTPWGAEPPAPSGWGDPSIPPAYPPQREVEPFMIDPRVKHWSQYDRLFAALLINDADKTKTIEKIGCLTIVAACLGDFFAPGTGCEPRGLLAALKANGGYNKENNLVWGVYTSLLSRMAGKEFQHEQDVSREKAMAKLVDEKIPIILELDNRHFVIAVGVNAEGRIIYNDVGTQFGDGYEDPNRNHVGPEQKYKEITRYDYIIPV